MAPPESTATTTTMLRRHPSIASMSSDGSLLETLRKSLGVDLDNDDEDNASDVSTLAECEEEEEAPELVPVEEGGGVDCEGGTCETLYGPYPSSTPVPFLDKSGATPPVRDASAQVDYRDVGTPDEWLPRDGRLVRLTGRHPFNVEPPLSVHQNHPFLTPTTLQYVRNHGACPKLTWEGHRVSVGGRPELVPHPLDLGMDDLAAMEPRELPVTLVCAGNRRKEQNKIRQTIGFNWGAAGLSTSVWKGVPLRDLLQRAGVSERNMRGKHVEFIGYEDLPNKVGPGPFPEELWGKQVKYGTSVPLARAMNPAYDILIAYEANGERLQPDHGFPVRLIIPGYIGGRMVKWLAQINVIPHETRNHYHYHDNRILPPHITYEESLAGEWWYKPVYIFNDLNINSAVTKPDHGEAIPIAANLGESYELGGYAYAGGGRKVTRVEITLDKGVHWCLATVHCREVPTEYGMHWCWVRWSFSVRVVDLAGAKEIWCRAWDEASNVQPIEPTWNLMGMGNNQVFRVKIHLVKNQGSGEPEFRFEHPTQPGQQQGGWMTRTSDMPESAGYGLLLEEEKKEEEPVAAPVKSEIADKVFTLAEVQKHNTEEDCWIVVNNKVYDCTEYMDLHPGGMDSILINGGCDATEDFEAIHSTKATKMLEKFCIGTLEESDVEKSKRDLDNTSTALSNAVKIEKDILDSKGRKVALDPKKKKSFALQSKTVLSRDSFLLDFALPTPQHVLGLPTGKHVFLSATIDNELVMRRYTPISSDHDKGCVKFVVKAYRPCERFPRGGKLSQHLDALAIGDTIDIRGPVGEFEYVSRGKFRLAGEDCFASRYNMMAGGTGITPVMQVAAEILRDPEDMTRVSLVFACRVEGDLLMRGVLEDWERAFPERFRVHYVLSDGWPAGWKHSTGFVNKELFQEHLYPPGEDVYNLMCGPPVMLERGCTPNLLALGHDKDRIFSF